LLFLDLAFVWRAFCEIHDGRQVAFDILPLTTTDVCSWFALYSVTGEEAIEMFQLVRAMDRAYLKEHVKKNKYKKNKRKKGGK
jgi:hypothetical protein